MPTPIYIRTTHIANIILLKSGSAMMSQAKNYVLNIITIRMSNFRPCQDLPMLTLYYRPRHEIIPNTLHEPFQYPLRILIATIDHSSQFLRTKPNYLKTTTYGHAHNNTKKKLNKSFSISSHVVLIINNDPNYKSNVRQNDIYFHKMSIIILAVIVDLPNDNI